MKILLTIINWLINWLVNNADWLQAIEAIIVIFGLPVGLICWLFSLPYKPRVKLYFDPEETYHRVFAVDIKKDSFWLHLMVKNKSPFTDIKNALGFASSVWKIEEKQKHILSSFRGQLQLKWAHENDYNSKGITRGGKRRLDVCFAHEGDRNLFFVTQQYPSGTQRVLSPGEYLVLINLTADSLSKSKSFLLNIFWNGNYSELKAKPYKKNIKERIWGLPKGKPPQRESSGNYSPSQTITSPPELIDR